MAESTRDILWLSLPLPGLHYLVGVGTHGNPEGSSQSEVSQLDGSKLIDKQVLRLQVSVDDPMAVTEIQPLQQLEQVALWECPRERAMK